ncbi:hypothetical protein BUALT_Bualt10G0085200 [Buddleja alternifolia]|uniref:Uncharacterized protein n=1 Tax=Buddleja alternifolia TaxID=168488 RepID=A0AAV6X4B5_9LAMI|nr:hypothetical protein BUALT_Bualt10G0085200 [Buddleja alternifolia]
MHKKRQETNGGSSASRGDVEQPKIDIKSVCKYWIMFLTFDSISGSSHMTWKQKKDLENRKVVSLGGKPPKKQRLPLSVARVTMKKQKEREEKSLEENAILRRFGGYNSSSAKTEAERRRPEDRVLRPTEGYFRNGVLDVKHLLKPSGSGSGPGPAPRVTDNNKKHAASKGKNKKGGKKSHGKRKGGGGGKKRH